MQRHRSVRRARRDAGNRAPRSAAGFARAHTPLHAVVALALAGCATEADSRPVQPAGDAVVRQICTGCHVFPEPDLLPRAAWADMVRVMAEMPGYASGIQQPPEDAAVVAWYEARAPEEITLYREGTFETCPLRFRRRDLAALQGGTAPGSGHVQFADIVGDPRLELLVCDMMHGVVLLWDPHSDRRGELQVLGRLDAPVRVAVADLDQDGRSDLLVAGLGDYKPSDDEVGSIVWLRRRSAQASPSGGAGGSEGGGEDATFETVTLADRLGRVADVQPADLDGDGDLDLVVAEFGWRQAGRVFILDNRTDDWNRPEFVRREIDGRHGAIHVPVTDIDGDGRLDFFALLSQDHEAVVAYLNRGDLQFEVRDVWRAPHPAWGSSGMSLVDLDIDADLDLLLTNGDVLDSGAVREDHGVAWLENLGDLRFEWHRLTPMYAVHAAEAADMDGDGDLDIVASAFLPFPHMRRQLQVESIVLLEQVDSGRFEPRAIERLDCLHATLALADFDTDGDVDLAVGNLVMPDRPEPLRPGWFTLWENMQE